jgi:hypothetical protein
MKKLLLIFALIMLFACTKEEHFNFIIYVRNSTYYQDVKCPVIREYSVSKENITSDEAVRMIHDYTFTIVEVVKADTVITVSDVYKTGKGICP